MFSRASSRFLLTVPRLNRFLQSRPTTLLLKDPDVVNISIIGRSGQHYKMRGEDGWSLLETVQKNNLLEEFPDFGVCSGSNFCQTCHIYIQPEDMDKIPKLEEDSDEFCWLEDNPYYIPGSSRLACQIRLQKMMDNMEVQQAKNSIGNLIIPP